MAKFNADLWTPGRDQFGRFCWCNKISGRISYNPSLETPGLPEPPRAERVAPLALNFASNANVPVGIIFTPDIGRIAGGTQHQAEVATSKKEVRENTNGTGAFFFVNGQTRPEMPRPGKPNQETKPPPPPPRTPQPQRRREKEADQWTVERNSENMRYFYNNKTKEKRFKRPNCLKKYPPRR